MRALVLSGGGGHGAYQVGALQHLICDEGREYDVICGVSVGAINAACLAQYPKGKLKDGLIELAAFWDNITTRKVYRKRAFGMLSAMWSESVFDSSPLEELISANLDQEKVHASGRKLRLGCVCWETGEYRAVTEQEDKLDRWVIASASYPVFFKPVTIGGLQWSDGGMRHVTPIKEALDAGCLEVDAIICEDVDQLPPWSAQGKNALPGYLERFISIILKELAHTDLEVVGVRNDYAKLIEKYAGAKLSVQEPSCELAGSSLTFDAEDIAVNMVFGYEDAKAGKATVYRGGAE